jgi:phosphoglycolate phosphatase-like HAD superfamily hydrolase
MRIWFDMDGTIADLYGVNDWLEKLINSDPTPYAEAKPLVNLSLLARLMNRVQRNGFEVCIITALSKDSTAEYDEAVIKAKKMWLNHHLKSVHFDEIRFVPYWFTKNDVNSGEDILFDDEVRHLEAWTGRACPADEMIETLKSLLAA